MYRNSLCLCYYTIFVKVHRENSRETLESIRCRLVSQHERIINKSIHPSNMICCLSASDPLETQRRPSAGQTNFSDTWWGNMIIHDNARDQRDKSDKACMIQILLTFLERPPKQISHYLKTSYTSYDHQITWPLLGGPLAIISSL